MRRTTLTVLTVIAITALAWAASLGISRLAAAQAPSDSELKINAVRQNLHAVQMAVESYAMDHSGQYPEQLFPALTDGGYLAAMPANPYDESGGPMPEVRSGYDQPGGLSYLPLVETDEAGKRQATGYVLLAYGDGHARRYLRRTRQDFERYLPDGSHYNTNWQRVVQSLGGGTVQTKGVGRHGGAANISDAPCQ